MPSVRRRGPPDRLPDQTPNFLFTGFAGGALLRPWFDTLALHLVAKWYLPLSRGWAAAMGSKGSYDQFREDIGPAADRLGQARSLLVEMFDRQRLYNDLVAAWEEDFFGEVAPAPARLLLRELERVKQANGFMAMRRSFLPIRKMLPAAKWDIASPAAVAEKQAGRLADPKLAFAAPAQAPVAESHAVAGPRGPEFWIKMPSPSAVTGDTAWARVQTPKTGPIRGVLILLHGIGLEPEMWRSMAAPAASLIDQGICLISPEGPWHGRRCPDGEYGGERILSRRPLGFLDLFEAWVAECALWTGWARERFGAPVALGGVSLGALTAQIAVSAAANWPEAQRPDASILITTTGDMVATAFEGSLAEETKLKDRTVAAGWDRDALASFGALLQPGDRPGLSSDRIVIVLGDADTVTPYRGGRELAKQWAIPDDNLFVSHRGHFSTALGVCRDTGPLERLRALLSSD